MQKYSSELLDQVREALLSQEPDLTQVKTFLIKELNLSAESSTVLIYQVVQKLNLSLFPAISHLELIHTEGCNLACSYCFEKNMIGHKKMPTEIARLAVNLLFDYARDESCLEITHFGGEPTLNIQGIKAATEYAEKRALSMGKSVGFNMTSNGVLLDEDMVAYFADHNIQVLLSIDGCESTNNRFRIDRRGRGTFKQVLKGLEILKKRQPWIGAKMTVMPESVDSLFNDVLGLYDVGVNHFFIGHATGVDWSNMAMRIFEEQLRQLYHWYKGNSREDLRIDDFEKIDKGSFFGCRAGRNSIAVSIYGDISPCSKIMGFSSKKLVGKLGDVWHGLTHIRNRDELVSCARLSSACEEQGIALDFQGGCFAVNYGESGDLFQPSVTEHSFSLLKRSACAGCSGCTN